MVLCWRDGNTDDDLNDEGDDTLYYMTDANFNVTALIDDSAQPGDRPYPTIVTDISRG